MWPVLIALAAAVVALAAASERRHRRLRRRLADLTREVRAAGARVDRSERHVYAALAAAALARVGREPGLPVRFLSQHGEDAFLWDLFGGRLDGFYIEAGAFDGVTISATYVLEAVGWTGLLVEPSPARCEACRAARPRSRVVRAALGGRGAAGTTSFDSLEGAAAGMADLASSIALGERQREFGVRSGARVTRLQVPLTNLAALLTEVPPPGGRVDVCVLDVEGFEAQAIEGLELAVHRPRVMIVEDLTGGREERASGLLRTGGYVEVVMLGHNRVWVDGREEPLVARAKMLAAGGVVKE